MKNIKKDLPRGTYRVADGASMLGDGSKSEDHVHVRRVTPLETKREEIAGDPQYAAINEAREQRTTRLRRDKDVKPI